jgi:uncharacterized protein (TIGR02466 family)
VTVIPLFPTLLYYCHIPVPKGLVKYTLDLSKTDKGIEKSNSGGWHSSVGLHNDEYFVKKYLNHFGKSLTKQLSIPQFYLTSCWLNVNKKGDYNLLHNHPTNDYALVWFIKTPKNCGNLVYQHPQGFSEYKFLTSLTAEMQDKYLDYLSYQVEPVEGNCFLFPSHLYHQVEINQSDDVRISMSANLIFNVPD